MAGILVEEEEPRMNAEIAGSDEGIKISFFD
jgi:hypothetical protein